MFRTNDDLVFATDHRDPRSRALVMARGIVGRTGQYHTVALPLYKETYDLATGRCVSGAEYTLPVHPVRVQDGRVLVVVSGRDEQGGGEQGESSLPSGYYGGVRPARTGVDPAITGEPFRKNRHRAPVEPDDSGP